jgi:hypothetical protein
VELYVDITRADGRSERRPLVGERNTIGSSPEATVPITDAPELAPLHVLLVPQADGCWVAISKEAKVRAWVGGQSFENGVLKWGTEIDVGSVAIRLGSVALDRRAARARRARYIIGALIVCVLAAEYVLLQLPQRVPLRPPSGMPPLFVDLPAACPERSDRALAYAKESFASALAKEERYSYDPQDGIDGVGLLQASVHCFGLAGEAEQAESARRRMEALRNRIEEDYRVRGLRLERALQSGRLQDALVEIAALQRMVARIDGGYKNWLLQLQRYLEMTIEGAKEKKKKKGLFK